MKPNQKHTPGPWKVCDKAAGRVVDKNDRTIASCRGMGISGVSASEADRLWIENEANAQLIAAAPELLVACQYLMDCIYGGTTQVFEQDAEYGQSQMTACDLIEAAIKKATSVV